RRVRTAEEAADRRIRPGCPPLGRYRLAEIEHPVPCDECLYAVALRPRGRDFRVQGARRGRAGSLRVQGGHAARDRIQRREVPASRAAPYSDAAWIDAVFPGMRAQPADRCLDILNGRRKWGLAA